MARFTHTKIWCHACGHSVTSVFHDEGDCGLLNKVQPKEPHTHHYCNYCHEEWTT